MKFKKLNSGAFNFGLNTNCRLNKFEYVENDGNPYILVEITKNEKTLAQRYYKVTSAFDNNTKTTDVNNEFFKKDIDNLSQLLGHFLEAFVKIETLEAALKEDVTQEDFMRTIVTLLPEGFQNIPVDVFLEFQWSISKKPGINRTFLQLPKKPYHGKFIVAPKTQIEWKTIKDDSGLSYTAIVNDKVIKHPFTRTAKYLKSKYAYCQTTDNTANNPTIIDQNFEDAGLNSPDQDLTFD